MSLLSMSGYVYNADKANERQAPLTTEALLKHPKKGEPNKMCPDELKKENSL